MAATVSRPEPTAAHLVTLAERPDLLPEVAHWLRDRHAPTEPLAAFAAGLARRTAPSGPEQCFILLAGEAPVGTASLTHRGLDSCPDLTPWLTNLFVAPPFRGRGHALRLIAAVEAAGRRAAIPTLWLFTRSAAHLYARLGWHAVGGATFGADPVTLMRRDLQNPKA